MPNRSAVYRILSFGFVVLGAGMALAAVAWPTIADDLGLPIADLGILTFVYGVGYTTATLSSHWFNERFTNGTNLGAGAGLAAIGLFLGAAAPSWWILVLAMPIFGLGAGRLDAAGNAYIAVREGPREMGNVHGLFGVGAIIGPLVVTGLIAAGFSWRLSFGIMGAAFAVTSILVLTLARRAEIPTKRSTGDTSRLRITSPVFWALAAFFVYAGVAGSTGVWAFTFLTEYRGVASGLGGVIVAAYWAAFAASRFLFGAIGDRYDPRTLMMGGLVLALVAYVVFWLAPWPIVSTTALLVAGFGHGPFFPVQLLRTRERFGEVRAASVIGFQIAAVNVGGAIFPAAVGILVGWSSLAVVPPSLVVFAILTIAASEFLARSPEPQLAEGRSVR